MIYELDAWNRYTDPKYWWIVAMTVVWVLFTVVLFILEPFFLGKLYKKYTEKDADATFRFIQKFHWVLLTVSLITIVGAVAGAHGMFFVGV
jgi:peptidoglycan biosynthesis protein MviN/MurJ (putative lipid II flippase)